MPDGSADRRSQVTALLLGVLSLGLGLRAPLAGGRALALSIIIGLVAGVVGLILGLAARTRALQGQTPVGLCTAAVAVAVAGTLCCSLWVAALFLILPLLR